MPSLPERGLPLVVLVVCATLGAPQVAYAEPQRSDVDRQLNVATERLATVAKEHDAARSDIVATRAQITTTATRIATAEHDLAAIRTRITAIATWVYKTGPSGQLGAVLGAGSPAQAMDRLATINGIAGTDRHEVTARADLARQLDAEWSALRERETQQTRRESDLVRRRAELEGETATLRRLRDQLDQAPTLSDRQQSSQPPKQPAKRQANANANANAKSSTASKKDTTAGRGKATAPRGSGAAGVAVAFAYAQLGKPYQWAASGPRAYDCSGLTSAAWRAAGIALPHNAARQYNSVRHVSRAELSPGDLVFYYRDLSHVAIYVGDGSVIHAPTTGDHVRVQRVDAAPVRGYGRPT